MGFDEPCWRRQPGQRVVDKRVELSMAELKKRVDLLMIKMDERVKLLMTKMDIIIGALGIEPASAPDATRKQPQTPPPTSAPTPQTPPPARAPTPHPPPPASPPQNYARSGYGDDEDAGVVVDSENYDSDAGEDAGPGEYAVGKKRATATNGIGKPNAKKRATATNAAEKPDTKKRTTATTPAKKPAFRKLTEKQREYLATVLTSPLHVKKMTTEEMYWTATMLSIACELSDPERIAKPQIPKMDIVTIINKWNTKTGTLVGGDTVLKKEVTAYKMAHASQLKESRLEELEKEFEEEINTGGSFKLVTCAFLTYPLYIPQRRSTSLRSVVGWTRLRGRWRLMMRPFSPTYPGYAESVPEAAADRLGVAEAAELGGEEVVLERRRWALGPLLALHDALDSFEVAGDRGVAVDDDVETPGDLPLQLPQLCSEGLVEGLVVRGSLREDEMVVLVRQREKGTAMLVRLTVQRRLEAFTCSSFAVRTRVKLRLQHLDGHGGRVAGVRGQAGGGRVGGGGTVGDCGVGSEGAVRKFESWQNELTGV
ncbi:hypothetical protein PF006_g8039 [Phytophthora fragariae]|uniref:Uncharacterized protein n=1 Tax=Phytophthora fragariae TaxID=53985 RepID=A0A6A3U790_9STRA|nr:hypothetical protein PF006_g8039 [Phytophthora fragariae]